ncbi:hypothetical protein QYE76_054736 [Lolium multiflorum]|uniref:Reverse transcriptase domain-containing protein n=1 Tax=Lolium multiflorum TaxID=4521 RepID=A0AAD8WL54_LOLMU|nr:hypothetical protein QYE76_054736 [Lolium multiflorum]
MATHHVQWSNERAVSAPQKPGIYQINPQDALAAQVEILNKSVAQLQANISSISSSSQSMPGSSTGFRSQQPAFQQQRQHHVQTDAALEKELKETAKEVQNLKSELHSMKDYLQMISAKLDSLVLSQPSAPVEARFPAQSEANPNAQCGAITTRTGTVVAPLLPTPKQMAYIPPAMRRFLEKKKISDQTVESATPEAESREENESESSLSKTTESVLGTANGSQKIPFPGRFEKSKEDNHFARFLEKMRDVQITIPILEVVTHIPTYAKFFKEIISKKRSISEPELITMTKECSAIIQNKKLPQKMNDPGSFCIPCTVGQKNFNALCDLGSSVSVLPLSVCETLSLGELQPTAMTLQLADRTFRRPAGMLYDIPIAVEKFAYPVDFVVLAMEDNSEAVILGRPFLATAGAIIDVKGASLKLQFGEEEVVFDMKYPTHIPQEAEHCFRIDVIEKCVANECEGSPEIVLSDEMVYGNYISGTPAELSLVAQVEILENNPQECEIIAEHHEVIEMKPLPSHLKYHFLDAEKQFPVIISAMLTEDQIAKTLEVLRRYKSVIGYSIDDMKGISSSVCTHRIFLEDNSVPTREHQRRLNPHLQEVVKKEILKLVSAGIIYPISDSEWVSPIHVVPKKGGMTVIENERGQEIPTRTVTGWRICTDFRKLNKATRKDHFPLPFIDQMLERLAGHEYFCYLDGYSGFLQIPIHPKDQDKTTFTCPYGTFAYRRLPFGLCNAPGTFQRCVTSIFSDLTEKIMEVFMDDFTVYGQSFDDCLKNLETVLKRCAENNLTLNWEKCHFLVREGIVLGHLVSERGIEVDKAKVEVIAKLPPPINVKGIRSFLGHAGFYRRFIKDFSKIARPLTHLLNNDVPFVFYEACMGSFNNLKEALISAPIVQPPDWKLPFELMCDASDFAVGAVLGQRKDKALHVIYYASKTMDDAQAWHFSTPKIIKLPLHLRPPSRSGCRAGAPSTCHHTLLPYTTSCSSTYVTCCSSPTLACDEDIGKLKLLVSNPSLLKICSVSDPTTRQPFGLNCCRSTPSCS